MMAFLLQENSPYGHIDSTNNPDSNPASRALIEFSNQTRMNLLNEATMQRNGALKILLQNSDGQGNDLVDLMVIIEI